MMADAQSQGGLELSSVTYTDGEYTGYLRLGWCGFVLFLLVTVRSRTSPLAFAASSKDGMTCRHD